VSFSQLSLDDDDVQHSQLINLPNHNQPSLFSVVRSLVDLFGYDSDESGDLQLGLYGAFGYDLTFQFESIKLAQERDPTQRDLLLYLADEIVVVDQSRHS
jgi:anthranilate synthase